jgi:hypothetical protein
MITELKNIGLPIWVDGWHVGWARDEDWVRRAKSFIRVPVGFGRAESPEAAPTV